MTAAFDAHCASAHFARIGIGQVMPLIESRDVQMFSGPNPIPPAG